MGIYIYIQYVHTYTYIYICIYNMYIICIYIYTFLISPYIPSLYLQSPQSGPSLDHSFYGGGHRSQGFLTHLGALLVRLPMSPGRGPSFCQVLWLWMIRIRGIITGCTVQVSELLYIYIFFLIIYIYIHNIYIYIYIIYIYIYIIHIYIYYLYSFLFVEMCLIA